MPFGRPVEPDEYIQNAMSSRCVSAGTSAGTDPASHGAAGCVATGPAAASPLVTTRVLGFVRRPRIRQIELQQVGRRQRIDEQRHEARTDGAEQRRRIGRRVVEEQQHTVAALQPERQQPGAECRDIRGQLGAQDSGIKLPELTDEEAEAVFDNACKPGWAEGFRLYKLYAQAAGFIGLERMLEEQQP